MNKMLTRIFLILLSVAAPTLAFAQAETSTSNLEILLTAVIILLMLVSVLLLVVAIYTLYLLRDFQRDEKELDNRLSPWWKALFYFTIIMAAIYLFAYHVFNVIPLSREEYNREVAQVEAVLEARQPLLSESIDEKIVEFTDDPVVLASGETIYKAQCVVCHAADGGGGIGPNFIDEYWLHGGSINNIFWIIKYGVPEKGMISWRSQLLPAAMRDVACYIYSLKGTIPANPKELQGELYNEETPVTNPERSASELDMIPTIKSVRDTMDDVQIGRQLFSGSIRFSTGGPACITCHHVTDDILKGGALIAPDLTNVYSMLDEKTIILRVTSPYHKIMQDAYKGKPVTKEEAVIMASFFKYVGTESTHQQQRN
ncbi:MAG: c-type cytochrome, partial [Bacteroidales bacterium]|nr:c-type cytochrome [Bacteroidales bacterium]